MTNKTCSKNTNSTRPSLIYSLKESKNEAWNEFYKIYAPLILNFARKRGCAPAQAEDVLQETVLAVLRTISNFDLDREGKFRSLLYKITESKIIDAYRRTKRLVTMGGDPEIIAKYQGIQGVTNSRSKELWEQTWNSFILSKAMRIAKEKVQPLTFKCFEQTFIKGQRVKDVAVLLDISPNLVAQHKHKVYTLIISEAEKLVDVANIVL